MSENDIFSTSPITLKAIMNECTSAWLHYLNVLNNLCTAGSKLSQAIAALEQYDKSGKTISGSSLATTYLKSSWTDLARSTAIATNTVKPYVLGYLQEYIPVANVEHTCGVNELEQKHVKDHNEMIILESVQTLTTLQHQFCTASYDAFSSLTCCFACHSPVGFPHESDCVIKNHRSQTTSPHNWPLRLEPSAETSGDNLSSFGQASAITFPDKLLDQVGPASLNSASNESNPSPKIPEAFRGSNTNQMLMPVENTFQRGGKPSLGFFLFPLNGQRRWSEAAAGEVLEENSVDAESQTRRWSMPWEVSKVDHNTVNWYQTKIMKTNMIKMHSPRNMISDQSVSNTPDSTQPTSITSQDGLLEAIQLLSYKPQPYRLLPTQCSANPNHAIDVHRQD